ncbi:SMC-Scp complex subunit ScpB [Ponticaulis sp.]|uniref:SMC-Scp complex subunit ScpB n=1 Tax=Ponticaulis sp. TaxID=2020902 RepID=UPI000B6AE92E|nr:SMC-Scp complex subunit ScpB [Ponticaulis sp.]OUX96267.1 MAG: SMC-Scp complex subunit ScpB [Hyphomonadaceae bacterium TMED5]|tara:strand:+ start:62999 stop:63790 length:792 start_codon:yes stop_codon:yes gene_type:complete
MQAKSEAEKLENIRSAVQQMSFAYKGEQERKKHEGPATSTPHLEAEAEALRRAEAVLFAAGEPLSAEEVAASMPAGVDAAEILMTLQEAYIKRGVNLVEVGGRWRFQTARDLSFLFTEYREEDRKLSGAALETLSIIAYCQPVTRAEIEDVRGVAVSKGTIDILLQCGWVRHRGRRKTPGRPVTYGTTDAFLEHFGLESLDTLPGKSEFQAAGLLDSVLPVGFEMPRPSDSDEEEIDGLNSDQDDENSAFHTDFLAEDENSVQ